MWLLAVLFSPIGVVCFGLGQTSFLTTAAMLFLIVRDLGSEFQQHPVRRGASDWADAVVLWALTAKPPVAVTSGVVFLARRRWRCIGLAVALGLLSTAVLAPAAAPARRPRRVRTAYPERREPAVPCNGPLCEGRWTRP